MSVFFLTSFVSAGSAGVWGLHGAFGDVWGHWLPQAFGLLFTWQWARVLYQHRPWYGAFLWVWGQELFGHGIPIQLSHLPWTAKGRVWPVKGEPPQPLAILAVCMNRLCSKVGKMLTSECKHVFVWGGGELGFLSFTCGWILYPLQYSSIYNQLLQRQCFWWCSPNWSVHSCIWLKETDCSDSCLSLSHIHFLALSLFLSLFSEHLLGCVLLSSAEMVVLAALLDSSSKVSDFKSFSATVSPNESMGLTLKDMLVLIRVYLLRVVLFHQTWASCATWKMLGCYCDVPLFCVFYVNM